MSTSADTACVVLGGGGHAAMVVEAIQMGGLAQLVGILDQDSSRHGEQLLGVPILGDDTMLPKLVERGVGVFAVGVGGVGDNGPRSRIYQSALDHGLRPLTVVHPSAIVSPGARVGAGAQILPGAIVNTGTALGVNVIVNSGSIVEHDCLIADHAHIAPGVTLAGAVRVAEGAHIGLGATVLQRVSIGKRSVVAAGAVVIDDVPDHTLVAGVPARVIRSAHESK